MFGIVQGRNNWTVITWVVDCIMTTSARDQKKQKINQEIKLKIPISARTKSQ